MKKIIVVGIAVVLLLLLVSTAGATWYNDSWSHRKEWNVSNINATALTNYPAYINVTDEPEIQADWDDVVFTDSNSVLIPYELENYTAGFGDYWVNLSSLSGSGTYTGWTYYGNDAASSQENPEGVYDSHTIMVHHMQDLVDSTSNDNDATNHGATYTSSGQVDGAYDFVVTESDYLDCENDGSLNITNTLTLEGWVKIADMGSNTYVIIAKRGATVANYYFAVKEGYITFAFNDGSWQANAADTVKEVDDGAWHHVIATYNKVNYTYYIDGAQRDSNVETADMVAGINDLYIGNYVGGSQYFGGTIDNIIVSDVARSADWINQSYELVVNQSSWVSWGSAEEQEANYNIFGYVFTTDNYAIENAYISNNVTSNTTYTNSSGYYNLSLADGTYQITATAAEYASNSTIITVSGADESNVNITLSGIGLIAQIGSTWINWTWNGHNSDYEVWINGKYRANTTIGTLILSGLNPRENHRIDIFKDSILIASNEQKTFYPVSVFYIIFILSIGLMLLTIFIKHEMLAILFGTLTFIFGILGFYMSYPYYFSILSYLMIGIAVIALLWVLMAGFSLLTGKKEEDWI